MNKQIGIGIVIAVLIIGIAVIIMGQEQFSTEPVSIIENESSQEISETVTPEGNNYSVYLSEKVGLLSP